jgi:threonylcarbamoyladenosine tRNA methylthiotransferase MtaB
MTGLYQERILLIKSLIPDCCIGADIMVGFPGETDELFLESYNFIRDLPISYLHVFTYSERPNTLAASYSNPVPSPTRQQRSRMLRILSDKKRRAFYLQNIGEIHSVLLEDDRADGLIFGFTRNYIRVGLPENTAKTNDEVEVKLAEVTASGYVTGDALEYQIFN